MRARVIAPLLLSLGLGLTSACVKDEPFRPSTPPPEPEAPLPPEPERSKLPLDTALTYSLIAVQSSKCVQFAEANDGGRAEIRSCDGSPGQSFRLQVVPGGYHRFVNVASNKCLDVSGVAKNDGAPVIQWACGEDLNQQWIVADAGPDTQRLLARHSGKALDVNEEKIADGTPLSQWAWKNSPNQVFRVKRAEAGGAGVAVAAAGGGGASGKGAAAAAGSATKSKAARAGKGAAEPGKAAAGAKEAGGAKAGAAAKAPAGSEAAPKP